MERPWRETDGLPENPKHSLSKRRSYRKWFLQGTGPIFSLNT
jgi:hypothetical protein